ncbi:hypothetical protein PS639_05327 [Pseudomonas fluorescens]|nr:hypothetical protein PS639_05327 [Pseudomonas fluorescens]
MSFHCVSAARAGATLRLTTTDVDVCETISSRGCCTATLPCSVEDAVISAALTGPSDVVPGTSTAGGLRLASTVNVAARCGELVSLAVMTMVRVALENRSMAASRPAIGAPPEIVTDTVIGVRPPSTSTTMRDCSGNCTVAVVSDVRTMP